MVMLKNIFTIALVLFMLGCNDSNDLSEDIKNNNDYKYKTTSSLPFGIDWKTNLKDISKNLTNLKLERYDEETSVSFYSIGDAEGWLSGMDSYNLIVEDEGHISALNFAQFFNKDEQRELLSRYEELKNEINTNFRVSEKKERIKNNKTLFKCLANENCGVMYTVYHSENTTVLIRAYGIDDKKGMLQVIVFPRDGNFSITS